MPLFPSRVAVSLEEEHHSGRRFISILNRVVNFRLLSRDRSSFPVRRTRDISKDVDPVFNVFISCAVSPRCLKSKCHRQRLMVTSFKTIAKTNSWIDIVLIGLLADYRLL